MRAPNGATMKNAQPLPLLLLEVGLPLPTTAGLPDGPPARLPCGATAGDPSEPLLPAGAGLGDAVTASGGGWDVTGAALVGAGTDETCER
jgi:hypothetical protein